MDEKTEAALSVLIGQPLRKITRAADTLCLQFGQMVEKKAPVRGEDEKWTVGTIMAGEYALQISCCFRLFCGEKMVSAKSDLYQISAEAAQHFSEGVPEDFDYDIVGNNRLDEIISSTLNDLRGFQVKDIKVGRLGDVRIRFANGFEMEILIDVSGGQECWRFFRQGEDHLVMTGSGISVDEAGEAN